MFSKAHIFFIIFSFIIIVLGVSICDKKKIPTEKVVWACFFIGLSCEIIKILIVIDVVPLVEPDVENGVLTYKGIGKFYPYIETAHIPFQLCSFQIVFLFLARVVKNEKWKRRIYSLIYATSLIGGIIAILLSSIAPYYNSTREFLLSIRAWEFYLYHSMLVMIAIVIAKNKKCNLRFSDAKWTCVILFMLDIFSFYMNSMLSVPLYVKEKLIGLTHSVNCFSSYENPIGINITTKAQYLIYLLIRFTIALLLILAAYVPFLKRDRDDN